MWLPIESFHIPTPRLMETETVQNLPFGTIVRAYENLMGAGEFIYLQGVASTAAGDLVTYNPFTGVTTRGAATANDSSPIGFAMAPCVANLFGWYQIGGTALANNNGTAAAGNAFTKATAQIGSAAVAGTQILGAGKILTANNSTFTKTCTTRNGSTELFCPNLDGVYVGMALSGTGIPGSTTVAAGANNGPSARGSSAGSAQSLVLSAAATADGTVTVTFTRSNQSLIGGSRWFGQGQIT